MLICKCQIDFRVVQIISRGFASEIPEVALASAEIENTRALLYVQPSPSKGPISTAATSPHGDNPHMYFTLQQNSYDSQR